MKYFRIKKFNLLLLMAMLMAYIPDVKAQSEPIPAIDTINSVVVPDKDRDFYFVYIVNDNTGWGKLIETLRDNHKNVRDNDQIWVFYLANGNNPVIVESTPEKPNDTRFEEMLNLIWNNSEMYANSTFDLKALVRYFNKFNYVDDEGNLLFNSVSWRIYTTSDFLKNQVDDPFIPSIYWVFDMRESNIFAPYVKDNEIYDTFGKRNYAGINENLGLQSYTDLE